MKINLIILGMGGYQNRYTCNEAMIHESLPIALHEDFLSKAETIHAKKYDRVILANGGRVNDAISNQIEWTNGCSTFPLLPAIQSRLQYYLDAYDENQCKVECDLALTTDYLNQMPTGTTWLSGLTNTTQPHKRLTDLSHLTAIYTLAHRTAVVNTSAKQLDVCLDQFYPHEYIDIHAFFSQDTRLLPKTTTLHFPATTRIPLPSITGTSEYPDQHYPLMMHYLISQTYLVADSTSPALQQHRQIKSILQLNVFINLKIKNYTMGVGRMVNNQIDVKKLLEFRENLASVEPEPLYLHTLYWTANKLAKAGYLPMKFVTYKKEVELFQKLVHHPAWEKQGTCFCNSQLQFFKEKEPTIITTFKQSPYKSLMTFVKIAQARIGMLQGLAQSAMTYELYHELCPLILQSRTSNERLAVIEAFCLKWNLKELEIDVDKELAQWEMCQRDEGSDEEAEEMRSFYKN